MPYVNCASCGIRSFVLAPWSTVDRCPACEAPLAVPRQRVAEDLRQARALVTARFARQSHSELPGGSPNELSTRSRSG